MKGRKISVVLFAFTGKRFETVDRVFRLSDEGREWPCLARAHLSQNFGDLLRCLVEKRKRVLLEALGFDRLRFHPRRDLVQKPIASRLASEVLSFEEPEKIDQPAEPRRVAVPRRDLEYQLRLLDDRLRRHRQNRGRDHVDGNHVEDHVGRDGEEVLPAHRHPNQRGGGGEPLVPSGKRKLESALDDGGTDDRPHHALFGGDELLAEALGVGVDVGPAPILRFREAEVGQARADPVLALSGDGEAEGLLVVGIAALLQKSLPRELAKPVGERFVLRFVAHARGEPLAVVDFLFDAELGDLVPLARVSNR